MTNRLELNWKLDGLVEEQRYYCSEYPIDPENLPAPKDILLGDVRTYTDTSIEAQKTYYVRIGSVKNGVEKLSAEAISVFDQYLDRIVSLLHFNNGLNDETGRVWTNSGIETTNDSKFGGSAARRWNIGSSMFTANTVDFEWWNPSGFTIECFAKAPTATHSLTLNNAGRSDMICVTDDGERTFDWGFGINEKNVLSFGYWSGAARLIQGAKRLDDDEFHHIAFSYDGQHIRIFADGILEASALKTGTPTRSNVPLRIGAGTVHATHKFTIDELRITKACRYIENFTPPVMAFKL